jgi:gluconate kinase
MQLFLFGQIGSGKSYVGEFLRRRFGVYFHDADGDLPQSLREAVHRQLPISDKMRDEFTEAIIWRIKQLHADHNDFCVAQAIFKNKHREKLLRALPKLEFVWVQSPPDLVSTRLRERKGHLATAYYGEIVNPGFEAPTLPHLVIENTGDERLLHRQLSDLLKRVKEKDVSQGLLRACQETVADLWG